MPSFARFRTNFFTFLAPLLRRAGAVLPNAPVLFCKFSFHSLLQPFFEMPKMGEKSRKPLSRLSICCAAVECGGYLAVIDSDREVCILAVGQAALFFFRHYYGRGRPFFQTVPKKICGQTFPFATYNTAKSSFANGSCKRKTGKGESLSVSGNVYNFYLVFITLSQLNKIVGFVFLIVILIVILLGTWGGIIFNSFSGSDTSETNNNIISTMEE